jgi:DNA repair protein RadC
MRAIYPITGIHATGAIAEQGAPYTQAIFDFSDSPEDPRLALLHAALSAYIDLQKLRSLAAESGDLYQALRADLPPAEVLALLELLTAILRPQKRDKIKTTTDVAGLLMVEMSHLDQEELRTVLLDTKNQVQDIVTVGGTSITTYTLCE